MARLEENALLSDEKGYSALADVTDHGSVMGHGTRRRCLAVRRADLLWVALPEPAEAHRKVLVQAMHAIQGAPASRTMPHAG